MFETILFVSNIRYTRQYHALPIFTLLILSFDNCTTVIELWIEIANLCLAERVNLGARESNRNYFFFFNPSEENFNFFSLTAYWSNQHIYVYKTRNQWNFVSICIVHKWLLNVCVKTGYLIQRLEQILLKINARNVKIRNHGQIRLKKDFNFKRKNKTYCILRTNIS